MIKRLAMTVGLMLMLGLPMLAFGGSASAAPATPANAAVEVCQQAQEEGLLDELGITFGECVNIVKGPASATANNFIAGFCGLAFVQDQFGATNKGQCIKVVKELFAAP
jgi:hypothetical protein